MDCRHRPFRGGTHADQDEGGSHGAAECASENICETAGNHHGRNSGSNDCSQRDPEPYRRGHNSSGNNRQSDSCGSIHSLSLSGGFAIGDCQNASVSFCVGGTERNSCAGRFPNTRGLHGAGCNTVSGGIRIAHRQDAPVSARVEAFAVDCTVGSSRSFAVRDCHGIYAAADNVGCRKSRDATQV